MDAPKIQFPCDYPIKVVARSAPHLRLVLDPIVERHAGPLAASAVSERASAQQNFSSITYVIRATGEAQLSALFAELKSCPAVLLVL